MEGFSKWGHAGACIVNGGNSALAHVALQGKARYLKHPRHCKISSINHELLLHITSVPCLVIAIFTIILKLQA